MFDAAAIIGLYAETPVHPGTGATRGAIDLPVQRERHTGFPLIPASTIKGVLRDVAEVASERPAPSRSTSWPTPSQVIEIFGPKTGDEHGGALAPTDARTLLFPVRSLEGIFVWITCPFILDRLARDVALGRKEAQFSISHIDVDDGKAKVGTKTQLQGNPLVLEEEEFEVTSAGDVDTLAAEVARLFPRTPAYAAFRTRLEQYLAVISNTDFRRLVEPGTGTDVVTRIKLNERKTTTGDGGNMWVEELLPSDCLFYSLLLAMPSRSPKATLTTGDQVLAHVKPTVDSQVIQLGGDETVGRGWMRVQWLDGAGQKGGHK